MALYFFYQLEEKGKWIPALASEREAIIKNKKPALVSALDVDNSFDTDLTLDEIRALRYNGAFYADWDAADIDEAITHFKEFLTNLKAKDVNLDMLRLYATGKKGFHCEIPMQMFMGKAPANGMLNLPDIYREMAHALYVPTLDMRVYTARRGRMWRCQNVLRDNGKYKVQISADEALSMTPETYGQICSSPRNALPIEPASLHSDLGLIFAQARDKVEKGVAKKKTKKATPEPLKKFGGDWPETFTGILCGATIKPGVGWNLLSMQLAISAAELGKTEEQLLTDAEGLISSHESDSSRYNSASKRRADLREQFRYMSGNPCYEFSVGAILSLVIPETRANSDLNRGDYVSDAPLTATTTVVGEDGVAVTTEVEVEVEEDNALIRVSRAGIFIRSETGYVTACAIGLDKVTLLRKMDETDIGYEVAVFKNSKPRGTHVLSMDKLSSRAAFQAWSFTWSASMGASDAQTSKLADILSHRAEKTGKITYTVEREGVDFVVKPGAKSAADFEIIWACPDQVIGSKGGNYRWRSPLDKSGVYQSDLMNAPPLSIEDEELISNLLQVNTTEVLGKLLGWFSAAFLTQIIRRLFQNQFPSLQVFGQAGAGKSKTTMLLNHMHYFLKQPRVMQTIGTTPYPFIVAVASSASQPVVFEEVKAREMSKTLRDSLLNLFRCNYDATSIERGGLTKDAASKEVVVNRLANAGPIAFVGESVESQTAMLERCVVVSLAKHDRYGKSDHYHFCADRATQLGSLGRAMALNALAIDTTQMHAALRGVLTEILASLGGEKAEAAERAAFNIAVVVLGLRFLGDTLRQVFGDKFDGRIQEMTGAIMNNVEASIPTNMSEASRVLDVMSQLTRNPDVNYQLTRNHDYTVAADGLTMDLKLRTSYAKYVRWQRSLGQEVLYDNETAFIAGLANYGGTVKRACPDNEALYDSPKAVIYRLSLAYLDKENVDSFKWLS